MYLINVKYVVLNSDNNHYWLPFNITSNVHLINSLIRFKPNKQRDTEVVREDIMYMHVIYYLVYQFVIIIIIT